MPKLTELPDVFKKACANRVIYNSSTWQVVKRVLEYSPNRK